MPKAGLASGRASGRKRLLTWGIAPNSSAVCIGWLQGESLTRAQRGIRGLINRGLINRRKKSVMMMMMMTRHVPTAFFPSGSGSGYFLKIPASSGSVFLLLALTTVIDCSAVSRHCSH